jgi:aryl-alcohol dehydrogenase-like predicted oxidoreductase
LQRIKSLLERRRLGRSELKITKVGVGTAPIGSTPEWAIYWGPQDENGAIKTIQTAMDIGVNWIDTAPFYGWGRAEKIVGNAIKGRRDEVYLFTKCGTLPDGRGGWVGNLEPASIRQELEATLQRLQTDYIDLYQFHDPDPATPIEESWNEMQNLIDEGKVRFGGLSNHPPELIERALKIGPVVSSQNQYNPLHRFAESEIFPYCLTHDIGVLGWGSISEGVFADNFDVEKLDLKDFRRGKPYARVENRSVINGIRDTFRHVATAHGKTMLDAVIAWELSHKALTGAIVGIRSETEAREMVGGLDWTPTDEELQTIEEASAAWKHSVASRA